MSNRFEEIARRKQVLIEQCAREREVLAISFSRFRSSLSFGALLAGLGRTLKPYAVLVTGISTLVASGHAGKLMLSSGKLFRFGQAVLPLWYWWTKGRRSK